MADLPRIVLHNDETGHIAGKLAHHLPGADFRECNSYAALADLVKAYRPDIVFTVRFDGTHGYPRESLFSADGPR